MSLSVGTDRSMTNLTQYVNQEGRLGSETLVYHKAK